LSNIEASKPTALNKRNYDEIVSDITALKHRSVLFAKFWRKRLQREARRPSTRPRRKKSEVPIVWAASRFTMVCDGWDDRHQ
jgi:hypothetical protein